MIIAILRQISHFGLSVEHQYAASHDNGNPQRYIIWVLMSDKQSIMASLFFGLYSHIGQYSQHYILQLQLTEGQLLGWHPILCFGPRISQLIRQPMLCDKKEKKLVGITIIITFLLYLFIFFFYFKIMLNKLDINLFSCLFFVFVLFLFCFFLFSWGGGARNKDSQKPISFDHFYYLFSSCLSQWRGKLG